MNTEFKTMTAEDLSMVTGGIRFTSRTRYSDEKSKKSEPVVYTAEDVIGYAASPFSVLFAKLFS